MTKGAGGLSPGTTADDTSVQTAGLVRCQVRPHRPLRQWQGHGKAPQDTSTTGEAAERSACCVHIHVYPQGTPGTHCAGTPLCTQGQLDKVAMAPTEHLWVAPSTGQHLPAHRARGVGSPSAPCGGSCPSASGLGWPPRCCLPTPEEATQKLFCLPSRAKPRHTLGIQTDPRQTPHCPWGHGCLLLSTLGALPGTACPGGLLSGRNQLQSVPGGTGLALGMGLTPLHRAQLMVGLGSVGATSSVPLGVTGAAGDTHLVILDCQKAAQWSCVGTKPGRGDLSVRVGGVSMWENTGVCLDSQGRCRRSHKSEGRAGTASGTGMDETSMPGWMNELQPGSTDLCFVGGLSIPTSCS